MDEYEFEMDDDDCDIDTECESVTGFKLHLVSHKVRTAKKDYLCNSCGIEIPAKTKYVDFATKFMRTRLCIGCSQSITGEEVE